MYCSQVQQRKKWRETEDRPILFASVTWRKLLIEYNGHTFMKILRAFLFHDKFISWILACISHPSFALLINGNPSDWFSTSCVLRQDCPLSPSLFILGSELSLIYLQGVVQMHLLPAYKSNHKALLSFISYMQMTAYLLSGPLSVMQLL